MEKRKITIISTKNQSKNVIMSDATTLAELQADLVSNHIDYSGLTFYEGISKTELKNSNSILPHDIPYKGKITNELVFMLTYPNKKIKSGSSMNRKDIYNFIKARNLQRECVERFGKNYTQCKNDDLISFIDDYKKDVRSFKEVNKKTNNEENKKASNRSKEEINEKINNEVNKLRDAFLLLINTLSIEGTLSNVNAKKIKNVLYQNSSNENEEESPYSENEILKMFDFIE